MADAAVKPPIVFRGDHARAAWEHCQGTSPKTTHGGTSFWPLPKNLRAPFHDADPTTGLGPCCCVYCSGEQNKSAMVGCWDTLAVGRDQRGDTVAWLVHYPELRGVRKRR